MCLLHCLFGAVLFLTTTILQTNAANYVVLAPTKVRPGLNYDLTVTLMNNVGDTDVNVQMKGSADSVVATTNGRVTRGASKIFVLQMPSVLSERSYTLMVSGRGGITFENSTSITKDDKTHSIFIQTDKALYKPGDLVQFRTVSLSPSLKPHKGDITYTITDGNQNKIRNERIPASEIPHAVYNNSLKLSRQPVEGKWVIKVQSGGQETTKDFEVKEYVLPKFEASVEAPSHFTPDDKYIPVKIVAKYTYGEPVKGKVHISVKFQDNMRQGLNTSGKLENGEHTWNVDRKMLRMICANGCQMDGNKALTFVDWDRQLRIEANVTEDLTNINMSAQGSVELTRETYKLAISGPDNFKPGLIYTCAISLTTQSGGPPTGLMDKEGVIRENLQATITMSKELFPRESNVSRVTIPIETSGTMKLDIKIPSDIMRVIVEVNTADFTKNLRKSKTITEFKSRDKQSLQVTLRGVNGAIKGDSVTAAVKSTHPMGYVQYVVTSKGRIAYSEMLAFIGATETEFNLKFDNGLLAPRARLLVYTVSSKGEMVVDSVEFDVAGMFSNKVSASFDKEECKPGENIKLTVTAEPDSFVGILAVDKSVQLLAKGNDIESSDISNELKEYDSSSSPMPLCPGCMFRGKRSFWMPYWVSGKDASTLLTNAGLVAITDAYVYSEYNPGHIPVAMPGLAGGRGAGGDGGGINNVLTDSAEAPTIKNTKTREQFPETWLWAQVTTGADGRQIIETKVPDTLTTWVTTAFAVHGQAGFGLTDTPAEVIVSKDFFVQPNLPYSIIKGEKFELQILVFNYMKSPKKVEVTLVGNDRYKIVNHNENDYKETVTAPPGGGTDIKVWIEPTQLGEMTIEVSGEANKEFDAVKKTLIVEPEGAEEEYSESQFIDLADGPFMHEFKAEFPKNVVYGSEWVTLTAIGDIMGPSINGINNLVRQPSGCGEQNMISFVPNIYALDYLTATGQLTPKLNTSARENMVDGYMRELSYQRRDGSFSAFGERDPAGSVWLTAFVMKSFAQAQKYIEIEKGPMEKAMRFISRQQNATGTFYEPPKGRVIHTEMQGSTGAGVGMTAYVLSALIEAENLLKGTVVYSLLTTAKQHAVQFLEQYIDQTQDKFNVALITYVLELAKSPKNEAAYTKLVSLATSENGLMYWEKVVEKKDEPPVGRPVPMPFWRKKSHGTASSVEMTAYALLTMARRVKDMREELTVGQPVIKYLTTQMTSRGGFHSTQDTVMALDALSEYSSLISQSEQDMTIKLEAGDSSKEFQITAKNSMILHIAEIATADAGTMKIKATGKGTGLVQMNVRYHVTGDSEIPGVELHVSSNVDTVTNSVRTKVCSKWTKSEDSGMSILEVNSLSGLEPVTDDLDKILSERKIQKWEMKGRQVVLYTQWAALEESCLDLNYYVANKVSKLKPASVTAYAYYEPHIRSVALYTPAGYKDPITGETNGGGNGVGAGCQLTAHVLAYVIAFAVSILTICG